MTTTATPSPAGIVIRYKRPPRKRSGEKSGFALRLEGSLAAVVTLAPVIPIFPMLPYEPSSSTPAVVSALKN
jgi:hypothetical protein